MRVLQKIPYLLLFILVTTLSACKEDDDKPDKPDNKLQYFECKINGEFFQAVSIPFQCTGPRFDYYPEAYLNVPEGYMLLAGKDCINSQTCGIRIFGFTGEEGSINFLNPTRADSILPYHRVYPGDSLESILYDKMIEGSLNIEELKPRESGNTPLGTIKGTFEFTLTDDSGLDTIRVTNGRFRFDVPQIF